MRLAGRGSTAVSMWVCVMGAVWHGRAASRKGKRRHGAHSRPSVSGPNRATRSAMCPISSDISSYGAVILCPPCVLYASPCPGLGRLIQGFRGRGEMVVGCMGVFAMEAAGEPQFVPCGTGGGPFVRETARSGLAEEEAVVWPGGVGDCLAGSGDGAGRQWHKTGIMESVDSVRIVFHPPRCAIHLRTTHAP